MARKGQSQFPASHDAGISLSGKTEGVKRFGVREIDGAKKVKASNGIISWLMNE